MKLWLTKLSVVIITFMTFGLYIPPTYLDAEACDQEISINDRREPFSESTIENFNECYNERVHEEAETITVHEQFVSHVLEQAKQQSFQKFGPKISNIVGDEFLAVILPKIEEVILNLASEATADELVKYEVTEKPANGYGEKIFHIYDQQTNKDVARFHVHRVNHPRNGHTFNFHYHLVKDQFEQHYHLGDIYWDKNTPPKWMS